MEQTVKQIGYPRWDKMLASKKKDNTKAWRNSSADSTYIYNIPFVRENENYVNASLNLKISGADTTFGYSCDWQYQQFQNTPNSVTDSAENFVVFLMVLDYTVFGHKKFIIKDTSIFKEKGRNPFYVTIEPQNLGGKNNVVYSEFCFAIDIPYKNCQTPRAATC
ncbi:MAG: hypothetical protein JST23_05980, partial [Bacteroidetes bacterium]|nr:hypothetical protein [Bacteroidota bacterium]